MTGSLRRDGPPSWPLAALALVASLALCLHPMPGTSAADGTAGQAHDAAAPMPGHLAAPRAGGPARPATVVRPLSCAPLADVPGKRLSTVLVTFPPGAFTGPHRHPGSVGAFVVSGAIRSQMAGGAAQVYTAGQTWFEPPRALHLFAENASATAPATLLATFVTDEDCRQLVIPEPVD
jgi:quercetin dioxygenase-like cupin family protein